MPGLEKLLGELSDKAAEYLFGSAVVTPYRILWVVAVMAGSVVTLPAVWSFADIATG